MRATGITRRMDDLGRVVIPKEIRRAMKIREGDPLEIYTDNDCICFRKYSPIGEMDLDTIKVICDTSLGKLGYTLYDRDGCSIIPKGINEIDVDDKLPANTCIVKADGDVIGYLQSPSDNCELTAKIVGRLFEN